MSFNIIYRGLEVHAYASWAQPRKSFGGVLGFWGFHWKLSYFYTFLVFFITVMHLLWWLEPEKPPPKYAQAKHIIPGAWASKRQRGRGCDRYKNWIDRL